MKPGHYPEYEKVVALFLEDPDFDSIIDDECSLRSLERKDVVPCIKKIYHILSKHAHGNSSMIFIDPKDFASTEVAGIVSVLRYQHSLGVRWTEVDGVPSRSKTCLSVKLRK